MSDLAERNALALERLADAALLEAIYRWVPSNDKNDETRRIVVRRLHERERAAAASVVSAAGQEDTG